MHINTKSRGTGQEDIELDSERMLVSLTEQNYLHFISSCLEQTGKPSDPEELWGKIQQRFSKNNDTGEEGTATRISQMKIDISIGELVDKVTILAIKLKKIKDTEKLQNIQKEYDLLVGSMDKTGIGIDSEEFKSLEKVNLKLWDIEDQIRIKEAKKEFDAEFIELARSVYFNNDHRAKLKKDINVRFGSDLVEEKEYTDY